MVTWGALGGIALAAAACNVDGPDNQFGVPTSASSVGGGTVAPGTGSSGEGSSGSESGADTGGTAASGSTTAPASTGADGSTGPGPGASSTGMGDAGTEQPAMGMYSECTDPNECTVPANLCLTVNMMSGFCTNMGCTDPVADCDPTPGGTAVPICFPVPIDDVPQDSCALDCSDGKTCPTGMMCVPLTDGTICA